MLWNESFIFLNYKTFAPLDELSQVLTEIMLFKDQSVLPSIPTNRVRWTRDTSVHATSRDVSFVTNTDTLMSSPCWKPPRSISALSTKVPDLKHGHPVVCESSSITTSYGKAGMIR